MLIAEVLRAEVLGSEVLGRTVLRTTLLGAEESETHFLGTEKFP